MPVALLEILSAGLKDKEKKGEFRKSFRKEEIVKQKENGNGSSPGSNRHFPLPGAFGGNQLPGNHLLPEVLRRESVARTGFRRRSFLLLAPGG